MPDPPAPTFEGRVVDGVAAVFAVAAGLAVLLSTLLLLLEPGAGGVHGFGAVRQGVTAIGQLPFNLALAGLSLAAVTHQSARRTRHILIAIAVAAWVIAVVALVEDSWSVGESVGLLLPAYCIAVLRARNPREAAAVLAAGAVHVALALCVTAATSIPTSLAGNHFDLLEMGSNGLSAAVWFVPIAAALIWHYRLSRAFATAVGASAAMFVLVGVAVAGASLLVDDVAYTPAARRLMVAPLAMGLPVVVGSAMWARMATRQPHGRTSGLAFSALLGSLFWLTGVGMVVSHARSEASLIDGEVSGVDLAVLRMWRRLTIAIGAAAAVAWVAIGR